MILALFVIAAGFLFIIKTDQIGRFTGDIPFAEKYLGTGGTYGFIKLIGLAMILLSIMHLTGGLDLFINATVGKIVPRA